MSSFASGPDGDSPAAADPGLCRATACREVGLGRQPEGHEARRNARRSPRVVATLPAIRPRAGHQASGALRLPGASTTSAPRCPRGLGPRPRRASPNYSTQRCSSCPLHQRADRARVGPPIDSRSHPGRWIDSATHRRAAQAASRPREGAAAWPHRVPRGEPWPGRRRSAVQARAPASASPAAMPKELSSAEETTTGNPTASASSRQARTPQRLHLEYHHVGSLGALHGQRIGGPGEWTHRQLSARTACA